MIAGAPGRFRANTIRRICDSLAVDSFRQRAICLSVIPSHHAVISCQRNRAWTIRVRKIGQRVRTEQMLSRSNLSYRGRTNVHLDWPAGFLDLTDCPDTCLAYLNVGSFLSWVPSPVRWKFERVVTIMPARVWICK